MRALRPDEVLAVEPGGTGLESRRHRQFAADHAKLRDWFYPSTQLLAHIDSVRATPFVPPVLTRTDPERLAAMSTDELIQRLADLQHVEIYVVQQLRDQAGMSIRAIAEFHDVSPSKISRMARQADQLSASELEAAARGLKAIEEALS